MHNFHITQNKVADCMHDQGKGVIITYTVKTIIIRLIKVDKTSSPLAIIEAIRRNLILKVLKKLNRCNAKN